MVLGDVHDFNLQYWAYSTCLVLNFQRTQLCLLSLLVV